MDPLFFAERYRLPELKLPAKQLLLEEGQISRQFYFIREGALRMWTIHRGNEMTSQFFFEGSIVASLDSFLHEQPSAYALGTMEDSVVQVLEKQQFEALLRKDPEFKEWFHGYVLQRFVFYSRHMMSLLKDKPEDRYLSLLREQPELLQRVPQHYIASYLGITPVSLSRIRNKALRKAKGK